jgi:uncharacterized phage protein gp47/JayE
MTSIDPKTGYLLKTQNEWFEEERQRYLDIDAKWNLDPSTPDGLKIASDAEIFANLDETLQAAYNSKDPSKAMDADLDTICRLTGTLRSLGTPSQVALTLTGVSGTVVISGKRVQSTVDGSVWTIDNAVTIGAGGTVSVTATCTVNGATAASIGTVTKIVDVVGGWQSVTNPSVATLGTNRQSDSSLRLERSLSVARPSNNQIGSTLSEVFAVDGVRLARVYENFTGSTDSNGLPAHSFAVVVDGGSDEDVAFAIYTKRCPGSTMYAAGTPVTVAVTDPVYSFQQSNITFSRPTYIDIDVTVTVNNGGGLPNGTDDAIKQAIVDYANGTLLPSDGGFNKIGFGIGDDVPISRIYTPVNNIIGQYEGGAFINGLTLEGGTSNVVIPFNALSRWSVDNIVVVINP